MAEANEGTVIPNENNVVIPAVAPVEGEKGYVAPAADEFVPTPTEEKAIARGWRPVEEWTGDPDAWVDARNYVQHGELMDEISRQKISNKKLAKSMDKFQKLQKGIEQKALEQAKAQLLADKEEALTNQDMAAVVAIDEEIKVADKNIENVVSDDTEESGVSREEAFDSYFNDTWVGNNGWFETNDVMKTYADAQGVKLFNSNTDLTPAQIFDKLDGIMKDKFPQEFENQNRNKPAAVGGVSTGGQGGGRSTVNKAVSNLNAEEIKVGNEYVNAGYFKDLAEYAAELEKM